jgi:ATP-dependent Lon protease
MCTALTSAIANIPIRQDVAMTGEISIRGRVLPIGGLKEKILAAKQAGITTVICPEKNRKDLTKIPAEIMDGMDVRCVSEAEEVLRIALNLSKPEEFMKVRALKVLENDSSLEVAN